MQSLGIATEIYTLINNTQIRPSANIVVSKCNANNYIENTKPELENLVSKYYEIFTNSSKYTGYVPDATIGDFFNAINCKTCEPHTILGGLSSESNTSISDTNGPQKDSSSIANQTPVTGENGSENIGMAVFKDDMLVGELNAFETLSCLVFRNSVDRFLITIPDPNKPDSNIDIYITPEGTNEIKIDTSTDSPFFKIKLKFSGRIHSMSSEADYLNEKTLNMVSNACNSYLQERFANFLYKTSKEYKSDICGFGKYALGNFLTTKDYEDYDWLTSYTDSFFDVKVETNVRSSMLLVET